MKREIETMEQEVRREILKKHTPKDKIESYKGNTEEKIGKTNLVKHNIVRTIAQKR
ncbi:2264_t:CDS:2 [Rhizophagus irregularis]|nr:2264_t:CDS:2 [Rhizophagus irregularis]